MQGFLAAIMFFTRLPLWRVATVPAERFSRVVDYWSLTGWLTGGLFALVVWLCSLIFPLSVAVIAGICARLVLTGSLHEDGLADFFDGMGGGTDRVCILAIMKDSHIGSYGVIALILYFLLLVTVLSSLPTGLACAAIFAADPWGKFCASQLINTLPYARSGEQAKNRTIYRRMGTGIFFLSLLAGAIPLAILPYCYTFAALASVFVTALMVMLLRNRLQGYTGDCCGAAFLLSELAFYLTVASINHCQ